jgi:hypothetical protein
MDRIPDGEHIEFENAFYADRGNWIESLLVTSRAPFDPESVVGELSRIELFHHERVSDQSVDHSTYRLTVVAHEPYPFLLGVILRGTAIPNRLQLQDGSFDGVVTVKEWESFRALAEQIEEQFGEFELVSVNQVETTGDAFGSGQLGRVLRNELSQEQLTVLRTAHRLGYFEVPRRTSADEIADELDIAQSTLSERLRLAEKRLFDLVFSTSENEVAEVTDSG